jgi:hypothetical protein
MTALGHKISGATGSKAALNITFVDQRSALLCTWKVGTDPLNSANFPIFIECKGVTEQRKSSRKAYRLHNKETDWTVFMEKVKEKITEVKTHNGRNRERDVRERYENFIQIIKGKLKGTNPKRKNKNDLGHGGQRKISSKDKQPECVWWTEECDKVIRIRKDKLLKRKYCETEEIFLEYKREAISPKNRLREIKHENWKPFCEGIDKFTNPSYVWSRMKR